MNGSTRIARCCPQDLSWPFSTWSLLKLQEVLRTNGIADLSGETIRQNLKATGVSWQATMTWKASNDPEFADKMAAILDLYDNPPVDARVICADEFGPLNLLPCAGRGWFPKRRPKRLRATYNRTQGVRHMFGALGLATGQMYCRIRDRKRWTEVREWAIASTVELVFTPTYSSWLNWIESEFAALRYFALNGTDHRSHCEQDAAIGA
ncbi:IS630 family transposase [Nocardia salmonicida]|uniref:IS630 family transposase n=1 Tax=Nocardia salmonicida TaxID=53431 RepID=UPI0036AF8081